MSLNLGGGEHEPGYNEVFVPGAIPPQIIDKRSISRFFECSLGLTAWKSQGGATWPLRCNPSSGNLHPTEGYLLAGPIAGIGAEPGVYHYAPREHGLERRHEMTPDAWRRLVRGTGDSPFLVGLSSVHWREAWKYGERAFRYCQHDVGHALACLRVAAAMLGWRLTVLEELGDADVARLLGIDRGADYEGAEREHADLIALVSAGDNSAAATIDCAAIDEAADGVWTGRANQLSPRHVAWEIIDAVAEAAKKPRTAEIAVMCQPCDRRAAPGGGIQQQEEADGHAPTARQVVLRRRSGTDYDGVTALTREAFEGMLRRLMPCAMLDEARRTVPWDAISWQPMVHVFLFVYRVAGYAPGLYALVRDPAKVKQLRALTKKEFAWRRAAEESLEDQPLFMLTEGDCRRAAAQLSLGQDIAGDSAFSVAMVAEFEASLREFGPWFYRRLYWEAGMIGQVLYLEAEAAGLRCRANIHGTGIGAYFDDWVHETLGLEGHAFQDLYHFTVGGAVEDARLTTLPPYDAARIRA